MKFAHEVHVIFTSNSVKHKDKPYFRPYWFDMSPQIVGIPSKCVHVPPEVPDAPCY